MESGTGKRETDTGATCRGARTLMADVLFPRRCAWCGAVVGFSRGCGCEVQVLAARRPEALPVACAGRVLSQLETVWAPFFYISPVKEAVWRMKFYGELQDVPHYAHEMAQAISHGWPPISLVVPVPSTHAERRGRDNVPVLLAEQLGGLLKLPVHTDALAKVRETKRQMLLSGQARRQNVKDAFCALPAQAAALQNTLVLLVDDVLTTGSTLNECAKALHAVGAQSCAVCLALAGGAGGGRRQRGRLRQSYRAIKQLRQTAATGTVAAIKQSHKTAAAETRRTRACRSCFFVVSSICLPAQTSVPGANARSS